MTEPGAALGLAQLEDLEEDTAQRLRILERYKKLWTPLITCPHLDYSGHLAVTRLQSFYKREFVRDFMANRGIATGVHYPVTDRAVGTATVRAYGLSLEVLTLPCYAGLGMDEVKHIIGVFNEAVRFYDRTGV
jgi:dTDP-4-amino-4,6-dideoxygalactose transaminase